jgi:hypothetical protein
MHYDILYRFSDSVVFEYEIRYVYILITSRPFEAVQIGVFDARVVTVSVRDTSVRKCMSGSTRNSLFSGYIDTDRITFSEANRSIGVGFFVVIEATSTSNTLNV